MLEAGGGTAATGTQACGRGGHASPWGLTRFQHQDVSVRGDRGGDRGIDESGSTALAASYLRDELHLGVGVGHCRNWDRMCLDLVVRAVDANDVACRVQQQ